MSAPSDDGRPAPLETHERTLGGLAHSAAWQRKRAGAGRWRLAGIGWEPGILAGHRREAPEKTAKARGSRCQVGTSAGSTVSRLNRQCGWGSSSVRRQERHGRPPPPPPAGAQTRRRHRRDPELFVTDDDDTQHDDAEKSRRSARWAHRKRRSRDAVPASDPQRLPSHDGRTGLLADSRSHRHGELVRVRPELGSRPADAVAASCAVPRFVAAGDDRERAHGRRVGSKRKHGSGKMTATWKWCWWKYWLFACFSFSGVIGHSVFRTVVGGRGALVRRRGRISGRVCGRAFGCVPETSDDVDDRGVRIRTRRTRPHAQGRRAARRQHWWSSGARQGMPPRSRLPERRTQLFRQL